MQRPGPNSSSNSRACGSRPTAGILLSFFLSVSTQGGELTADRTGQVPPNSSNLALPHAAVSRRDDLRAWIRAGRVQWVRFEAPAGARLDIATAGGLVQLGTPAEIGLMVGPRYRLRLSNIRVGGQELVVYPTVQLIGFISPPSQVDPLTYPIPVPFKENDFEEGAQGRLVTNVVYLEDPTNALPEAFPAGEIPMTDLAAGDDPLERAGAQGRPIALIQIGNRIPLDHGFEEVRGDPPVFFPQQENRGVDVSTTKSGSLQLLYQVYPHMANGEFVCDGTAQVPYVHFTGHGIVGGLEPGETAGQFRRPGEQPRAVSAYGVCVYAPRFGLMRSSWLSSAMVRMQGPQGIDRTLRRGGLVGKTAAQDRAGARQSRLVRRRQLAARARTQDIPAAVDELRVLAGLTKRERLDETVGRIGPNSDEQAMDPRIAMSIQAAVPWIRMNYPAYTALTRSGSALSGRMRTAKLGRLQEPDRRPGELIIWKTAGRQSAKQGDLITFAVHYRNTGELPLESISIIDSLVARLEYIAGSAKSDHRAVFTASPNDVGSQELRWDILDTIPGGAEGVVWFQAKVR